jgi:hypothetical protein
LTRTKPGSAPAGGRGRRIFWFVLIYCASAAGFAALTYGLRAVIPH